jgi:hypothetical protein
MACKAGYLEVNKLCLYYNIILKNVEMMNFIFYLFAARTGAECD